jgi:hypothetical protein
MGQLNRWVAENVLLEVVFHAKIFVGVGLVGQLSVTRNEKFGSCAFELRSTEGGRGYVGFIPLLCEALQVNSSDPSFVTITMKYGEGDALVDLLIFPFVDTEEILRELPVKSATAN